MINRGDKIIFIKGSEVPIYDDTFDSQKLNIKYEPVTACLGCQEHSTGKYIDLYDDFFSNNGEKRNLNRKDDITYISFVDSILGYQYSVSVNHPIIAIPYQNIMAKIFLKFFADIKSTISCTTPNHGDVINSLDAGGLFLMIVGTTSSHDMFTHVRENGNYLFDNFQDFATKFSLGFTVIDMGAESIIMKYACVCVPSDHSKLYKNCKQIISSTIRMINNTSRAKNAPIFANLSPSLDKSNFLIWSKSLVKHGFDQIGRSLALPKHHGSIVFMAVPSLKNQSPPKSVVKRCLILSQTLHNLFLINFFEMIDHSNNSENFANIHAQSIDLVMDYTKRHYHETHKDDVGFAILTKSEDDVFRLNDAAISPDQVLPFRNPRFISQLSSFEESSSIMKTQIHYVMDTNPDLDCKFCTLIANPSPLSSPMFAQSAVISLMRSGFCFSLEVYPSKMIKSSLGIRWIVFSKSFLSFVHFVREFQSAIFLVTGSDHGSDLIDLISRNITIIYTYLSHERFDHFSFDDLVSVAMESDQTSLRMAFFLKAIIQLFTNLLRPDRKSLSRDSLFFVGQHEFIDQSIVSIPIEM